LQSTALTAVRRCRRVSRFGPFGWLSSFRLPLDSRKDFTSSECGRVTARYRRYIGIAASHCRFSLRATLLLLALGLGRHRSLPLHPGSCVFGGRCHVRMAINLGQRRPVAGANTVLLEIGSGGRKRFNAARSVPLGHGFQSRLTQSRFDPEIEIGATITY
jgi:hypothetical protein